MSSKAHRAIILLLVAATLCNSSLLSLPSEKSFKLPPKGFTVSLPERQPRIRRGRFLECYLPLVGVSGCVRSVFFSPQSSHPSPLCCKALEEVDKNCWNRRDPIEQEVPSQIWNFCGLSPTPSPTVLN
ncbi:uncharacterized protein LOC110811397 [Carica papaya]|uniref:uncharacterized protein LOC110811397 n=1 Tax=Carica papaya TaxID=3649 RepID=UPI000B8CD0B3|nr:uncharacterized protein LOC110811397 [Carica papaya]